MCPKYIWDVIVLVCLFLGNVREAYTEFSIQDGLIIEPDSATTSSEEAEEVSKERTDLKSLMLKYESDDGNSCLLDLIKDEVIWWQFPNGTLRDSTKKYGKPIQ